MSDRETIDCYNTRAAEYTALELPDSEIRSMAAFVDGLPSGAHILDLGCGPGLHGAAFLSQGFEVSGLDASVAFVTAATERGLSARLGSFFELDDYAAYDGVWASFSLLHASRAEFPDVLARAVRALRPDGRLYISMKLGTEDFRDAMGRLYGFHTVEELHKALGDVGMKVIWQETGRERGFAGTIDPVAMMVAIHE